MIGTGLLTFQEYIMREQLPLSTLQQGVLDFLQNRDDVVLFGAQAVNAYVAEPRMTQDVDLLSTRAHELADELESYLKEKFRIAVRIREVAEGRGYRLYQVRKEGNRHLVDIRAIEFLPSARTIDDVKVISPEDLIAYKVIAYHQRRGKPKSGTDWRDLAMLLLAFPDLKNETGKVLDSLRAAGASAEVLSTWKELASQEISPEDEEDF